MTLQEITFNIIKLSIGGGIPSSDKKLKKDQVAAWVNYYRAKLLKEYYLKYRVIDPQYIQDLGCVELECVDKADCCQIGIYESYLKVKGGLPEFVDLREGSFFSANLVDKINPITIVSPLRAFYRKNRRYGRNAVVGFRIGRNFYLDVPQGSLIKYINIRAILSDPRDVERFTNCDGSSVCEDFWEAEYPVPADLIQVITQMILSNELNLSIQTNLLDDTKNDGREIPQSTTN